MVVLLTMLVAFINNDYLNHAVKSFVKKESPSTVSQREMSDNNIDFACNLFRAIYEEKQKNKDPLSIVVSPIGVSYMLGMLNEGADGETRQQINDVFRLCGSVQETSEYLKKIMDGAPNADTTMMIKITNSLDDNKSNGFKLIPQYKADMLKYYNVQIEALDFTKYGGLSNIDEQRNPPINGMSLNIFYEPGPKAAMNMLNTASFNALWTEAFTSLSNTMQFTTEYGYAIDHHYMMRLKTRAAYGKNDLCEMLCLPYGNGGYSMYVLLPCEDKTIGDIIKNLSAKNLEELRSHMANHVVDILMPSFTIFTSTHLKDVLSAMGMPLAFDKSTAKFIIMARGHNNLYVSMMMQRAQIKVNEKGTKAAANTVIDMSQKEEPDIKPFHATRPFVYYIVENSTGTIYFMGAYRGLEGEVHHHPEFTFKKQANA